MFGWGEIVGVDIFKIGDLSVNTTGLYKRNIL